MQVIRGNNNQETGPMSPRRSPEDHRLWPLQLLSGGAVQTRASECLWRLLGGAHQSVLLYLAMSARLFRLVGPFSDTFRNIIRGNSTIPRCTGGPRIRGSLWSDSFGHEPTSVGRLDYRLFALIFSKTHFLRHEIHSRYTITITRIVYAIVLF